MNKNTKLLFTHKLLYDIYFYGAITIPFFVVKGYGVSVALVFASMYAIMTMAMEVPTGVIGDRFGHKNSVFSGVFLTGLGLFGLLVVDTVFWDASCLLVMATGASLTSGSDTALLRSISNHFERDNRTFDYLKSVMLLLSFGAAGFAVKYLSINIVVGLSGALAFAALIPLVFITLDARAEKIDKRTTSFKDQIMALPAALRGVTGGLSLIILAGMTGAVAFSAKEIISSLNPVYQVDITWIGIIAALAMFGRIVGTALEKRLRITYIALLIILALIVSLTAVIGMNTTVGILFLIISSIVAQMLFYRLSYRLSSQAPQSHIASLLSGLGLVSRLFTAGIILLSGLFAGLGYFNLSFIAVGLILALFGGALALHLEKPLAKTPLV